MNDPRYRSQCQKSTRKRWLEDLNADDKSNDGQNEGRPTESDLDNGLLSDARRGIGLLVLFLEDYLSG